VALKPSEIYRLLGTEGKPLKMMIERGGKRIAMSFTRPALVNRSPPSKEPRPEDGMAGGANAGWTWRVRRKASHKRGQMP
jgi:hypothetical protein